MLNKHAGTQAGPYIHAQSILNRIFQTDGNINMHHYRIWSRTAGNVPAEVARAKSHLQEFLYRGTSSGETNVE